MYKIKTYGWESPLGQIDRIRAGLVTSGNNVNPNSDEPIDFVYAHCAANWDKAIDFYNICKSKGWNTRLLLKVLDLAIHLRSDFTSEKQKLLKADIILANSQYVKKQIKELLGLDSYIVYEALPDLIQQSPVPKTVDYLMLGRLSDPNKRTFLAYELLNYRQKKYQRNEILAGCGPESFPFNHPNAKYIGTVDQNGIQTLYNNTKITLCLSKVEGFLLCDKESACMGTPYIVCSDMTTAEEFVPKEFIAEPNVESISNKVDEILGNYSYFRNLALECGNYFRSAFNKIAAANRIIKAYESIR